MSNSQKEIINSFLWWFFHESNIEDIFELMDDPDNLIEQYFQETEEA